MVKNCDRGLENTAEAVGLGQHFQSRGHSFSPYGPPSRQITYIYCIVQYFIAYFIIAIVNSNDDAPIHIFEALKLYLYCKNKI